MKGLGEIRHSVSGGPIVRRDAVASDVIAQAERGKKPNLAAFIYPAQYLPVHQRFLPLAG